MDKKKQRLQKLANDLKEYGRNGDTMLAHITPKEAALLKSMGGAGTTNPDTGLPEFFEMFDFGSWDAGSIGGMTQTPTISFNTNVPTYTPPVIDYTPPAPVITTPIVETPSYGNIVTTPEYQAIAPSDPITNFVNTPLDSADIYNGNLSNVLDSLAAERDAINYLYGELGYTGELGATNGGIDNTGASMTAADADVAFGADQYTDTGMFTGNIGGTTGPDNIDIGGGYNSGMGEVGDENGMFTGYVGGVTGPDNIDVGGGFNPSEATPSFNAITTAREAMLSNELTTDQLTQAAKELSKATGMDPFDALISVVGGYDQTNSESLKVPMHSDGISYADIAVAKVLGLGGADVNYGQTVDQALAAANVQQNMPSAIGFIFNMAGQPVLAQLAKGLAQVGMGQNTLGGLISSFGLKTIASQLGVPSYILSALAQTDLGKSTISALSGIIDTALEGGFVNTDTTQPMDWSVMDVIAPQTPTGTTTTPTTTKTTPTTTPQRTTVQPEYTDWYLPSSRSLTGLENPFARSAKERGNIANYILGD